MTKSSDAKPPVQAVQVAQPPEALLEALAAHPMWSDTARLESIWGDGPDDRAGIVRVESDMKGLFYFMPFTWERSSGVRLHPDFKEVFFIQALRRATAVIWRLWEDEENTAHLRGV